MAKGYERKSVKKTEETRKKSQMVPRSRVIKRKIKNHRTSKFKIRLEAHRGYHSSGIPENTIPAFKKAIEYDVDGIELDIWLTKDGIPVVWHGTNEFGGLEAGEFKKNVNDATFQEIRDNIKLGTDGSIFIPTLDEVLTELKGQVSINIELKGKDPETVPKVLEIVKKHDMFDQVHFSSFHHAFRGILSEALQKLKIKKKVVFGFINKDPKFSNFDAMKHQKGDLFTQSYLLIQENREEANKLVAAAREKGLRIGFYFPLNHPETDNEMKTLLDEYKSDFVITNFPDKFGEFFGKLPPPEPKKKDNSPGLKKKRRGSKLAVKKGSKTGKK